MYFLEDRPELAFPDPVIVAGAFAALGAVGCPRREAFVISW